MIRERRLDMKRCLVEAEARRADVLIKEPAALVVEQASRKEPLAYSVSVRFSARRSTPVVDSEPELGSRTETCLAEALRVGDDVPGGVRVELSAFSQPSQGFNSGGHGHRMLATHAAVLGSLHYARGEYELALAYFEDAYWVFHRPEYKFLVGRCHDALGRPRRAEEAYAVYVEERPHAPETPELRLRLQ